MKGIILEINNVLEIKVFERTEVAAQTLRILKNVL